MASADITPAQPKVATGLLLLATGVLYGISLSLLKRGIGMRQ